MGEVAKTVQGTCPYCAHTIELSLTAPRDNAPVPILPGAATPPSPPVELVAPALSSIESPTRAPVRSAVEPARIVTVPPAAPRVPPAAASATGPTRRSSNWRTLPPVRIWKRYFPPVRLVWIFLVVIVWNADGFVSRAVAWPLLALPITAALADLGLQAARFPRLRFPDAAIANGLFLSVILWPVTVSIELTAVAVATVGVRHLLRVGGHPVFNPAALGVTLAATIFALPQPWHVGLTLRDTELVAILGLILWSRAWHTWRIWVLFFVTNIAATLLLADYLAGSSVLPLVIQTSVLGAAPVFYGFFMVSEPRTAPSNRRAMLIFGALVGISAAVMPVLLAEFPTYSALGVLTPYLALFFGNVFAVALPSARGAHRSSSSSRGARGTKTAPGRGSPESNA